MDKAPALFGAFVFKSKSGIVNIALADGKFDEQEKAVMVNVISNLTGADMTDAMWLKVDELIHKFNLHGDSEAFIEHLDEENEI